MKFLFKFFNKHDTPWVNLIWNSHYASTLPRRTDIKGSFWWRDLLELLPEFKDISRCLPGCGSTISLWNDDWEGGCLSTRFPRIFSFATDTNARLQKLSEVADPMEMFSLPLTTEALEEFQLIWQRFNSVAIDPEDKDTWLGIWGNGSFKPSHYYKYCFSASCNSGLFSIIWKNKCVPKLKGFCWLLSLDRLNTRDLWTVKTAIGMVWSPACSVLQALEKPVTTCFSDATLAPLAGPPLVLIPCRKDHSQT